MRTEMQAILALAFLSTAYASVERLQHAAVTNETTPITSSIKPGDDDVVLSISSIGTSLIPYLKDTPAATTDSLAPTTKRSTKHQSMLTSELVITTKAETPNKPIRDGDVDLAVHTLVSMTETPATNTKKPAPTATITKETYKGDLLKSSTKHQSILTSDLNVNTTVETLNNPDLAVHTLVSMTETINISAPTATITKEISKSDRLKTSTKPQSMLTYTLNITTLTPKKPKRDGDVDLAIHAPVSTTETPAAKTKTPALKTDAHALTTDTPTPMIDTPTPMTDRPTPMTSDKPTLTMDSLAPSTNISATTATVTKETSKSDQLKTITDRQSMLISALDITTKAETLNKPIHDGDVNLAVALILTTETPAPMTEALASTSDTPKPMTSETPTLTTNMPTPPTDMPTPPTDTPAPSLTTEATTINYQSVGNTDYQTSDVLSSASTLLDLAPVKSSIALEILPTDTGYKSTPTIRPVLIDNSSTTVELVPTENLSTTIPTVNVLPKVSAKTTLTENSKPLSGSKAENSLTQIAKNNLSYDVIERANDTDQFSVAMVAIKDTIGTFNNLTTIFRQLAYSTLMQIIQLAIADNTRYDAIASLIDNNSSHVPIKQVPIRRLKMLKSPSVKYRRKYSPIKHSNKPAEKMTRMNKFLKNDVSADLSYKPVEKMTNANKFLENVAPAEFSYKPLEKVTGANKLLEVDASVGIDADTNPIFYRKGDFTELPARESINIDVRTTQESQQINGFDISRANYHKYESKSRNEANPFTTYFIPIESVSDSNIPAVNPFFHNSAEPLDSLDKFKPVGSPVNELDGEMAPVLLMSSDDSTTNAHEKSHFFLNSPENSNYEHNSFAHQSVYYTDHSKERHKINLRQNLYEPIQRSDNAYKSVNSDQNLVGPAAHNDIRSKGFPFPHFLPLFSPKHEKNTRRYFEFSSFMNLKKFPPAHRHSYYRLL